MQLFLIRREQVESLAAASVEQFEDNVAAHLREVWPDETGPMDDDEVLAWVRYGVARGAPYGIETEYDVARFIDLMFVFDAEFDANETLPWAAEILRDDSLDGRRRVDALMRRADEFCATMASALED